MFKVVWKSFKYNRKNFLSFFMSEILSVAVIFMLIYIQEALSQVPGIKTEALQFAYQSELRKQLRIIIPCIILIMILVTGYSVKAYINTRIWDYKLFQLLGIRKKNLKVMIGLEYVISGMLACGFGILFGLIGTKIIKEILHTRINARFVKGISMSRVYLVLILSCLIMTIGVYITLQILLDTRTNLGDKIFKIKESRIHSMISVIYFIVGILVISSGYLLVNNDPMMAYMALICILTGLIILMIFGTGFFMDKFSESKYYKKHILAWNDCYCYIKKHGFRMLMQILLGIILIFNTFLMLRGTIHDRCMPNDFVCIGNSKETTAVNTVVTARFNGLTKQFPFLWCYSWCEEEGRVFIRCERNIQRHVVVPFTCDRYKWNVLRRIYKILLLRNNGNCFDTKGSCNVRMDFMHIWNYFYDIYYFFNQAFMERNFKNMG